MLKISLKWISDTIPTVHIIPALTRAQQNADKILRQELKVRGTEFFKISHGKIVLRRNNYSSRSETSNEQLISPKKQTGEKGNRASSTTICHK